MPCPLSCRSDYLPAVAIRQSTGNQHAIAVKQTGCHLSDGNLAIIVVVRVLRHNTLDTTSWLVNKVIVSGILTTSKAYTDQV